MRINKVNTLYTKKSKKKYSVSFIVVLIAVVLCSCLLIGTVAAWLTRTYKYSDSDNQIGSVSIKLYSGNQEITGTITEDDQTGLIRWSCNTLHRAIQLPFRLLHI